jgi:hypothetical protein
VEPVAANAPLPIPLLRDGISVGIFRQRRVERGIEYRHVGEMRDRGQTRGHRRGVDAVVERGQVA